MLNLASVLEGSALEYPKKTALIFGDKKFTYGQLNGAANQVAHGLQKAGIKQGDKVALTCPNLPFFPIVYYGILKTGATVVPLNVLLKKDEIEYHLQDSDATAYLCFEGTPELPMGKAGHGAFESSDQCKNFWMITADPTALSEIEGCPTLGLLMKDQSPGFDTARTIPEDTAVILYTSGTTGHPKGAELSHSNLSLNALSAKNLFEGTTDDIHLVTLPLFHSFGQTAQMNAGFLSGNTLVFIPRFDPDVVFASLLKEKVTIFAGVPTMYWALLNCPNAETKYDLDEIASNLRLSVSGGSALPVEIIKQFNEKFHVEILEGYGLSETSPIATFNKIHREKKPGSIGTPIWGVDVQIVDPNDTPLPAGEIGEIIIRGHNVMKGYYNQPEETEKSIRDGWFHTGDMAKQDKDGFFYIVDRLKDMVIRGGYNVYPREIEETLLQHPAISMAAVIGVPDEVSGEEVKAHVILKEGVEATPEEIIAWSKEKMAAYKYPRLVEIRTEFPMTATGKILKRQLKEV